MEDKALIKKRCNSSKEVGACMFKHFVADSRWTTGFVVGKLVNSRDNLIFSEVKKDVGVPGWVDVGLGVVFNLPLGVKYVGVDVAMSSPVIKMLLDM